MLTHGDAHKAREIYKRRKIPIPDDMWPPALLPGAQEWLAAFHELSTERQIGMGVGPIPGSAIRGWPVAEDERELFHRCIRAMDGEYLSHARADQPVNADTNTVLATLREKDDHGRSRSGIRDR